MDTVKSAPHLWKIHGATMASLVCHVPCVCCALHVQEGHVSRLLGGMQIVCECPTVQEVVCCASFISYLYIVHGSGVSADSRTGVAGDRGTQPLVTSHDDYYYNQS